VVDNNSEDRTREIAKRCADRVLKLDCERTWAKNLGASIAKGKYVLFIDSDMRLTERVVEDCVKTIENSPNIGGIIVPERTAGESFWARVRDFERSFYIGTEMESARFYRKELVLRVSGFDENVVFYEESTLSQKIEMLDYNVKARIRSEILHDEDHVSLSKRLKGKFHYGRTIDRYKENYPKYGKRQTSLVYRCGLFLGNKRFYSKPLTAIEVLTLKYLEYLALILGYLTRVTKE
jgi:glycosyltransferase involved in cell wall biosynthesis